MSDYSGLSAMYNIGADGLNGFQRDCNNHRWKMGIPEDDERPYLFITTQRDLAPSRILMPIEGAVEDMQMRLWEKIDELPHSNGKVNCGLTLIGPRDTTIFWFVPEGWSEDIQILETLKSFLDDLNAFKTAPEGASFSLGLK